MKSRITFLFVLFAFLFTSCKENDKEIIPNTDTYLIVPTLMEVSRDGKEYKLGQFKYNKDFSRLESLIYDAGFGDQTMTFQHDAKGLITSMTSDNINYKFVYTNDKITKATLIEQGETIQEKIITYTENKIARIKDYYYDDKGVLEKTPSDNFEFTYVGDNLSKFVYYGTEFNNKKITVFEGTAYDENVLSETSGLGIYNQVIAIALAEDFALFSPYGLQTFFSKNAVKSISAYTGLFELSFLLDVAGFDNLDILSDADIAKYNTFVKSDITSKLSSNKLYSLNNLYKYKEDKEEKSFSVNITYNEKLATK